MSKLIDSIKQLVARVLGQEPEPDKQKKALVKGLMGMLEMTQDKEMSCGEVFDVVDRYAEAIVNRKNVSQLMPLVHHHMQMCHECRDELEMLLEMMQAETA